MHVLARTLFLRTREDGDMRKTIRTAALAMAVTLLWRASADAQQDVTPVSNAGCIAMCSATAITCTAIMLQHGGPVEFCLGYAEGCVAGCNL